MAAINLFKMTDAVYFTIQTVNPVERLSFTVIVLLFLLVCILNFAVLIIILAFNIPRLFTKKILSTSLKVALNKKSHTFKFLRLIFSVSIVSGIIIALICFSLAYDIALLPDSSEMVITAIICGTVSGIVTASTIVYIIRKVTHSLKKTITRHVSGIRHRIKRRE